MRIEYSAFAIILLFAGVSFADSGRTSISLEALAREAVSRDAAESAAAIHELRSRGPEGLDALLEAYSNDLNRCREVGLPSGPSYDRWRLIASAIDRVAAQHDAYASGLYWYTDFEQAKAASKASSRPILSLRLLGRLEDDLSCANSRFFRTTLYSNSDISKLLREHFILHWESVRAVPKVTIDFGDGRKLERTLTGNSIHYVLDADGRAIDALPGLYGPGAFLRQLQQAEQLAATLRSAATDRERDALLRVHHQARVADLSARWNADLRRAGVAFPPRRDLTATYPQDNPPTAATAAPKAITKSGVEIPLLRRISSDRNGGQDASENEAWARIAMLYRQDARLDEASLALIRNKNRASYGGVENAGKFQLAMTNLQRAIAEDTVRNRYTFETTLHQWFVDGTLTRDLRALNERVYASLFLTPSSDPWLGLLTDGAYTGIENEGATK